MIPLICLSVSQSNPTPIQVLHRVTAYVGKGKTVRAEYTLTSKSFKGEGKAVMSYERPNELCYTMKWGQIDYRFVGNTAHGYWDANYATKTYDDADLWMFDFPFSRGVSGAPNLFEPGFLVDGSLNCFGVGRPQYIGKATVNGVSADEIEGKGPGGTVDLYVTAEGKPVRCIVNRPRLVVQADLSSMQLNGRLDAGLFTSNPPIGFHEWTVPIPTVPISISEKFPLSGWAQRGAPAWGQGTALVMVTAPGCAPSARSAPLLADIKAKAGLPVVLVSVSKEGGVPAQLQGYPVVYDPSGKLPARINAPGTPMFYLLGSDGTVIKSWYGFDPEGADNFEADIISTSKGAAKH